MSTYFIPRGASVHAPSKILLDGRLSSTEKLVLFGLFAYAHKTTGLSSVYRAVLASRLGLTVSVISRVTKRLAELGWLSSIVVHATTGGTTAPNDFQLCIPSNLNSAPVPASNPTQEQRRSVPVSDVPPPATADALALVMQCLGTSTSGDAIKFMRYCENTNGIFRSLAQGLVDKTLSSGRPATPSTLFYVTEHLIAEYETRFRPDSLPLVVCARSSDMVPDYEAEEDIEGFVY